MPHLRRHRTTKETPRERYARDEQVALLPLRGRLYHSLVLPPRPAAAPVIPLPRIQAERRPLKSYAAVAAAGR
jgi:hypothetical protein